MRIKNAAIRKTRIKKLHLRTKGFFGSRGRLLRQGKEAVLKAEHYAYRGRKERKRQMRSTWIVRINAALLGSGVSYSRFIHGLKLAGIGLDRKALAQLAVSDPAGFSAIVGAVRQALGQ